MCSDRFPTMTLPTGIPVSYAFCLPARRTPTTRSRVKRCLLKGCRGTNGDWELNPPHRWIRSPNDQAAADLWEDIVNRCLGAAPNPHPVPWTPVNDWHNMPEDGAIRGSNPCLGNTCSLDDKSRAICARVITCLNLFIQVTVACVSGRKTIHARHPSGTCIRWKDQRDDGAIPSQGKSRNFSYGFPASAGVLGLCQYRVCLI